MHRGADHRKSTRRSNVTIQDLEGMLLFAARLVDRKGEVARPILDRCEREYLRAKYPSRELERVKKLIQDGDR